MSKNGRRADTSGPGPGNPAEARATSAEQLEDMEATVDAHLPGQSLEAIDDILRSSTGR